MNRLFVSAMNVHGGGGRTLLIALLESLREMSEVIVLVDRRFIKPTNILSNVLFRAVPPTVWGRGRAEAWLARQVTHSDRLLCFGNLPPLLRSRGAVTVFLQNRFLVDEAPLSGFPARTRMRLAAERRWLRCLASHADLFIVQTPSMLSAASLSGFLGKRPVIVRPFLAHSFLQPQSKHREVGIQSNRFLYVASGEPHKNHRRLVLAWSELAARGVRPELVLTVGDEAPELRVWIGEITKRDGLNITNHGRVSAEQVSALYESADAMIYPSLLESFGLPLLEAKAAGLPIIASELDYVRDVALPAETFDPQSVVSIVRAVARFKGIFDATIDCISGAAFIDSLAQPRAAGSAIAQALLPLQSGAGRASRVIG